MARLRRDIVDNDDDFDTMMQNEAQLINTPSSSRVRRLPSEKSTYASMSKPASSKSMLIPRTPTNTQQNANRVRLLPISALQHTSKLVIRTPGEDRSERKNARMSQAVPLLNLQSPIKSRTMRSAIQEILVISSDEDSDVEESILCQSQVDLDGSDNEVEDSEQALNHRQPKFADPKSHDLGLLSDLTARMEAFEIFEDGQEREPETASNAARVSSPISRPGTSSDKENDNAILQFSPDRSRSPAKKAHSERPATPPLASPTKSRLQSPSKKAARIPTPPARPSLDQFWNAQSVNEWNDQHSPQKPLTSPRKPSFRQESSSSSSTSQKSSKSAAAATLKSFHATKHALATAFLAELDATITANQIAALTASTGGVQLIWSKTLNSTAGRANWRRETTTRTATRDPTLTTTTNTPNHPITSTDNSETPPEVVVTESTSSTYRHHASIELAEKVISDPVRLRNVLAHEFCHLANFMVSGVKGQPHGASFQAWGKRCTRAFGEGHAYDVRVTTKHAYEIEYRYVWRCGGGEKGEKGEGEGEGGEEGGKEGAGCGREYERHSKSIDPRRHVCGVCRGKLVQVKPVPRRKKGWEEGEGEGKTTTATGTVSGYAAYVKMHFAVVKRSLPARTPHKEVMEALGKKYRAERAATGDTEIVEVVGEDVGVPGVGKRDHDTEARTSSTPGLDHIAEALEVVVLSDDEE